MHKKLESVSFIIVAFGIISPFIIQYLYYHTIFLTNICDQGKLGPISDWISGLITPCIALGSFVLLYITYISQNEELRLTREAMNDQSITLKRQRFETTFFNLLSLFQSNVNSLDVLIDAESVFEERYINYKGRNFFKKAYEKLKDFYWSETAEAEEVLKISRAYDKLDNSLGHYYNHHFNNVYQMLKLIYVSDLDIKEKVFYVDVIRQHLSKYEYLLLFYDTLVGNGCFNFEMIYEVGLFRKGNYTELLSEKHDSLYFYQYKGDANNLYPIDL